MKLVLCPHCQDVFKLRYEIKSCECGQSSGKYLKGGLHAEFYGEAIPLGFSNDSLVKAVRTRPKSGWGRIFKAFVIPIQCSTIKEVKK